MKARILIADDEAPIRRVMSLVLREAGYEVLAVENGQKAVDVLLDFDPHVILLDQQMPVLTGTQALKQIRTIRPDQIVILVTAYGSVSLAVDAVKKGAYDFIEKPFDNDNLILTVERALENRILRNEVISLRTKLGNEKYAIIGENSGLKQVVAQVKLVAETNATVLITGESGTGKELIAKSVHDNSPRSDKPFVTVNCGAIPLSLMESELFGHEKGAFTDAKEARAGTFEKASGGTLFLDEIGELPIDAQVKLLRVLEERKITRVGSNRPIPVDVRIIAATNRKLEEEVQKGNFRLDLLYRLNVFNITIPPLRERREDIPLLVDYFIDKHNKALRLSVKGITQAVIDRVKSYEWPGNVRDLENAIQSAMILTSDGIIQMDHLPLRVKGYGQMESLNQSEDEINGIRNINAQFEKELILQTLKKHNYNRTLTAESLAISRKTLFNKMKRYDIE